MDSLHSKHVKNLNELNSFREEILGYDDNPQDAFLNLEGMDLEFVLRAFRTTNAGNPANAGNLAANNSIGSNTNSNTNNNDDELD